LRLIDRFYCYDAASTNKLVFVCEMKLRDQLETPHDAVTMKVNSGGKES